MTFLLIIAAIFLLVSIQLWRGKWRFMIANYQQLPPQQREGKSLRALCRLTSLIFLGCALGIIVVALNVRFRLPWMVPFGMVLILISGLGGSFYASTSRSFHVQTHTLEEQDTHKRPKMGKLTTFLSILLTAAVAALFYFGTRPPTIQMDRDAIVIQGLYGTTIKFNEIMGITLLEESMNDFGTGRRLNGFDAGTHMLRGHFEAGLLFVYDTSAPTLQIRRWDDKPVYISFKKMYQTEDFYDALIEVLEESELPTPEHNIQ